MLKKCAWETYDEKHLKKLDFLMFIVKRNF